MGPQRQVKLILDGVHEVRIRIKDPKETKISYLLEQTQIKYAQYIRQQKIQNKNMRQIKKKIVVGLKSLEKNENIDYLL